MDVFEETLDQMCLSSGIERPKGGEISLSAPVGDFSSENLYKVLGTSRHSNLEGLKEAYAVNLTAARNLGDPVASLQAISRVEQAWKTLSNLNFALPTIVMQSRIQPRHPQHPSVRPASLSRAAGSPRHLNPWTH